MGNKNKPDFNFFFVQEIDEVNLDFSPRAINTVESDDDYDDDDNENSDNEHVIMKQKRRGYIDYRKVLNFRKIMIKMVMTMMTMVMRRRIQFALLKKK